ncbi:hypothetical protein M9458_001492, partial [Cirrhinus mrigala]
MSLASLRSQIAFFSERDSAPRALPLSSPREPVRKKQRGRGAWRSVPSELMPAETPRASLLPPRGNSPVLFSHPDQRLSVAASDLVSFGGSECDAIDDSMSLLLMQRSCRVRLTTLPPRHLQSPARPAQAWMPNYYASCLKVWRSWTWSGPRLRSPLVAAWKNGSCRGAVKPLATEPRHSFLRAMKRLPSHGAPPTWSACVPPLPLGTALPSSLSMVLKKRGMTSCPHWMSQWPCISARPWPSDGRRRPPTRLSRVGQLQPSLDEPICRLDLVLQVYQAKLLRCMDESGPDLTTFLDLCGATDLALRATKMASQAIGRSMASLVVLDHHLLLTLTEIKDADKVPFLDSPVSPTGLFGPVVEGFVERFTAVQKSSQAVRLFLPKHASSSSRPKPAPTQQPAKPAPSAAQSAPKPEPRHRSRLARRYSFLKCQGPWPKVVLDHASVRLPDLRERKRMGPSLTGAGPAPKLPCFCLLAPRSVPGADDNVFVINTAVNPGGVVSTSVQGKDVDVLRTEVRNLLAKGAVEMVPPAQSKSGFYSRYFLVSKKDGGDWICSLDLKDAYFHIQIAPHHRRFLRFAFEGVAYQYTDLPFGLSLTPRTFTKCIDETISPLRQKGIRILNYLDDWLILAQPEDELLSHRSFLLSHLDCLGLRVNFAKTAVSPSQWISFLGTVLDSTLMRAVVVPERALSMQQLAASFNIGAVRPLKAFQKMLGLMASEFHPMPSITDAFVS